MNREAWLHGAISKDESEALINRAGAQDGRFLLRGRIGYPNDAVLTVVYRARITHHLLSFVDGIIVVNNKRLGSKDCTTLEEMVAMLSTDPLPQGWPVKLLFPVPPPAPATKPPAVLPPANVREENGQAAATRSPPVVVARMPDHVEDPDADVEPLFLHNEMSKTDSEALLMRNAEYGDGTFFMRPRSQQTPEDYILSVIYRGKPSHHLIKRGPEGFFIVNAKPVGNNRPNTVDEVVNMLRTASPEWPVPLTHVVPRDGPFYRVDPAAAAQAAAAQAAAQADQQRRAADQQAALQAQQQAEERAARERAAAEDATRQRALHEAAAAAAAQQAAEEEEEARQAQAAAAQHAQEEAARAAEAARLAEAARAADVQRRAQELARRTEEQRLQRLEEQQQRQRSEAEAQRADPALRSEQEQRAEEERRIFEENYRRASQQAAAPPPPPADDDDDGEAARQAEAARQIEAERQRAAAAEAERARLRAVQEAQRAAQEQEHAALVAQQAALKAAQDAQREATQREEARRREMERLAREEQERAEAQRAEHARMLARQEEARREHARQEQARLEAAAQERQRVEREQQQRLAAQQEAARAEQQRREAVRQHEAAEAARAAQMAVRAEQARDEQLWAARRVEGSGVERVRTTSTHSAQGISALSGKALRGQFEAPRDTRVAPEPAVIVSRATEPMGRLELGPDCMNITVIRPSVMVSFGFALASLWTIDGRRNVVSWVDPQGPSSQALQLEDEIVALDGSPVVNLSLDDLKSRVRRCENEFKATIRRRPNSLAAAAPSGASRDIRQMAPTMERKCTGGVWCQCKACKKTALKEEDRLSRTAVKMATHMGGKGRVSVVLGHRGGGEAYDDPAYLSII